MATWQEQLEFYSPDVRGARFDACMEWEKDWDCIFVIRDTMEQVVERVTYTEKADYEGTLDQMFEMCDAWDWGWTREYKHKQTGEVIDAREWHKRTDDITLDTQYRAWFDHLTPTQQVEHRTPEWIV